MDEIWRIPEKNWEKINKESALFIFKQAECYLQHTIDVCDGISSRAYSLLIVCITLFSAIIGFSIKYALDNPKISIIIIYNFAFVFALMLICYLLIIILSPRSFMMKGRIPKEIAIDSFIDCDLISSNDSYLALIINEIESYQYRIEYNETNNAKRILLLRIALYILPFISIIYLILMSIHMF